MRWAVLIAGLTLAPVAAQADCSSEVNELQPQVDQAGAGRSKDLLAFDLQRARKEMGEGDEAECRAAVDHARKLLRGDY